MVTHVTKGHKIMKKISILLVILLLLAGSVQAFAQTSQLPSLVAEVPDPAQYIGSVGSLYQKGMSIYDVIYDAYLFPRPVSIESFTADYAQAAADAGYIVENGTLEVYSILRVTDSSTNNAALVFPDYQGYVMLLVPPSMNFTLHDQVPGVTQPTQLIEMGNQAIAGQDYQAAVRYLLKAAGIYLEQAEPQPTPTPVPTAIPTEVSTEAPADPDQVITRIPDGAQVYVVQEGDSCWSIAAQYGMDIQDFMEANNFTDCNIQPNDEVIIPGEEVQTPTPTPLPGAQRTYVVEAGDNCWSIAADKFGVNFELFMAVNGLTECNLLVGQEVIIPAADAQMPTMTPIPLDQYEAGKQIQYTVEMNDSYNEIAS